MTPIIPVAAAFIPPANAVWLGAVARNPAGAIYITTDTPNASNSLTCNGLLLSNQGVLFCEQVTA